MTEYEGVSLPTTGKTLREELDALFTGGILNHAALPSDVVTATTVPQPVSGVFPIINVKDFGAVGAPANDPVKIAAANDTAAIKKAVAEWVKKGGTLMFPNGDTVYVCDRGVIKSERGGLSLIGSGKGGTSIRGRPGGPEGWIVEMGVNEELETLRQGVFESHSCYNAIEHIEVDGNGRTQNGGGIHLEKQQWMTIDNVYSANHKYEAVRFGNSVRESEVKNLYCRFSGDETHPQIFITDDGVKDGANNLSFFGLRSVMHAGHGLQISGRTGEGRSPTRALFFYGTMLHGPAFTCSPEAPYVSPEGYSYTNEAEFRTGCHNAVVEDARGIFFEGLRTNAPAKGFASIRIGKSASGASSVNYVELRSVSHGSPFDWSEMQVTADPATDILTASEGHLRLGKYAVIRLKVTAGALPTGSVEGTDYWCVPQNENSVKIAETREKAINGEFLNLTDAGSGTIKIVPRDIVLEHEFGEVAMEKRESNASKDGNTRFVNRLTGLEREKLRAVDAIGQIRVTTLASGTPSFVAIREGEANAHFKIEDGALWLGLGGAEAIVRAWYKAGGAIRSDQQVTMTGAVIASSNFQHSGTNWQLGNKGSLGATPTVTGSRASGAALESLLTKLAERGVIVNSSTA